LRNGHGAPAGRVLLHPPTTFPSPLNRALRQI